MSLRNEKFDISVIVPTYNRSNLLKYTLQSLLLQNIDKHRFEVIVADDGSSDDSMQVAEKFASLMNVKYQFQDDLGFRPASARNMGIKTAEGSVCVFLDAGIIAAEDCLAKHFEFHKAKGPDVSAIGSIYGLSENQEMTDRVLAAFEPEHPASLIEKMMECEAFADVREMHFRLHNDKIHHLPAPWIYFWSGHISVSRQNLLKVGMFDEGYDGKWGIEDNDLGYRLHTAGVKIHLLRSAACYHYPHHTSKLGKEAQGRENCEYFHQKFQAPETELFLRYFGTTEFIDLNTKLIHYENDKCSLQKDDIRCRLCAKKGMDALQNKTR